MSKRPSRHQVAVNNELMDTIIKKGKFKSYRELCDILKVSQPTMSKIRTGLIGVSSSVLIRIHEEIGMPFSEIRLFVPKDGDILDD